MMAGDSDADRYGTSIPPDDEYAGWDWKQIAAAIIGGIDMSLSRQHDLQAEFSEPTSLTHAGNVFFALADQINYALVTFNYNINALLGDDGKGPWNGNAAKVAAANFTYFSTAVQKQLDAITGNGEPTRAIYNQLYNAGNYLNWAIYEIHEIDEFFSTWAAAHGAKVTPAEDGTNIVHVSDIKGLPEVIQKTMLPVIKQLANTYYVTHKDATLPPYNPPVLPPPKQPDNNTNIPNLDLSNLGNNNKDLPDALNNLGNKFGDGLNNIGDNFGDGLKNLGKNLGDGLGGLNNLKNLDGLNGLDNLKNLNGLNGLNNLRLPPPPDGAKNLSLPGGPDGPGHVPPLALPTTLGGPNSLGGPNRLSTIDPLGSPAFHLSAPGRFRSTDQPSGETGGRLGGGFDASGRPLDKFGRPILGGPGGGPGGGLFDRFGRPILGRGPGGGAKFDEFGRPINRTGLGDGAVDEFGRPIGRKGAGIAADEAELAALRRRGSGALAAEEAAAARGMGGMYPPMGGMGHGPGQPEQDRERATWLEEDEDVWGADPALAPAVLGRDG